MSNWIDEEAREHQKQMESRRLASYDVNPEHETALSKRPSQSIIESEQTEKTLHHLAGRVEELRARLERVLIPAAATGNGAPDAKGPAEPVSPLTGRLKSFRNLAQGSIDIIEDILNRLDV